MVETGSKKFKIAVDVTPDDYKQLGSDIMTRSTGGSSPVFERRWIAHFGVEVFVCVDVWKRLRINKEGPENAEPKHLLWALLLLKQYGTESDLAGKCEGVDEQTFRKWSWIFIEKISYLEHEVVSQRTTPKIDAKNYYLTTLLSCLLFPDYMGES
jgi:hypothetical protein